MAQNFSPWLICVEHISHSWAFPWRRECVFHLLCGHSGTGMNACCFTLTITGSGWKRRLNSCDLSFRYSCIYVSVPTHQALALLAVLHPRVPAAVGEQAALVQALAAQSGVALRAAEQVGVGVVAVADHPAAHHLASLSGEEHKHTYHMSTIKHWTHTCTLRQDHLFDGIIKHACR